MEKITKLLLLPILIMGLGHALQALAHGEGASFEQTVGDYLIDIGYTPEEPTTEDPVRFDFSLNADFTNIWVRIEQGNKTFFAGSVARARFGLTGLLYTFGESGDYEIFSRFENDNGSIVEASFPLTVKAGVENNEGGDYTNTLLALLGGLVLGVVGSLTIKRKK